MRGKVALMRLSAVLALPAISAVRVSLHYESLCKQCQIHVAGFTDDVIHGGLELSPADAGVLARTELSIDYYGRTSPSCETAAAGTEHGPDMCSTDRVHLCAQALHGGAATGAAARWWPFVHCMFMLVDGLKCGNNGHCDDSAQFVVRRDAAVPTCALLADVNATAIEECADGPEGVALANRSYAATDRTLADGFAPAYVDGVLVEGADAFWRVSPDQLRYGRVLLATVCASLGEDGGETPAACVNATGARGHRV